MAKSKNLNIVELGDPMYEMLFNWWVREDKPARISTPNGYYLAIRDNDKLKFVKQENQQKDNFSSFGNMH